MTLERFRCYKNSIPEKIGKDVIFAGKKYHVDVRLSPPHPKEGYSYQVEVSIETSNWELGNRLSVDAPSGTNTNIPEFWSMMRIFLTDDLGDKWYHAGTLKIRRK